MVFQLALNQPHQGADGFQLLFPETAHMYMTSKDFQLAFNQPHNRADGYVFKLVLPSNPTTASMISDSTSTNRTIESMVCDSHFQNQATELMNALNE